MLIALCLTDLLALGRADVDAHAAAGAVVGSHLDGHQVIGPVLAFPRPRDENRSARQPLLPRVNGFMRIAACGQTSAHRPHWMQMSGSQIGMSWAMLRFSIFAVPVGNVPSTGRALTGSRSPLPASSIVRDALHEIRFARHVDRRLRFIALVTCCGHLDFEQSVQRGVDGGEVLLQDRFASLAVRLANRLLDLLDRLLPRQHAGQGEEAGLHHRVDPAAHSRFAGHLVGVDDEELQLLVDDLLLDFLRQVVPDLVRHRRGCSAGTSRPARPTAACRSAPGRLNWWQATKLARSIR